MTRPSSTPRLAPVLAWSARIAATLAVASALSSYFAYSTAGFDFEREVAGGGVEVEYYRLRWDDGSTWLGRAVQPVARPDRPFDRFDPGGTLLDRPSRPARRTWWNRRGFWWVARAADDPYAPLRYPGATTSRWVAVPSWLVIAGAVAPGLVGTARRLARTPSAP